MNTHLLKREAILVGVPIFPFELHVHPFGVNSQYTCVGMVHTCVAFGCSNHFQVTQASDFIVFLLTTRKKAALTTKGCNTHVELRHAYQDRLAFHEVIRFTPKSSINV